MRAVRYHEHGGPEVLAVEDVNVPTPGREEVRIGVEAAAVNPVDTYFREGSYEPAALPMIPGADAAGVVEAVGENADLSVGDRVFATGLGNDRQGTYAESTVAPVDRVSRLPDGVSFAEAAAGALVGVTAWRALVHHAGLEPAEECLVHGGSGGVGHVAVQLGDAVGAAVTTTASERYHDRLRGMGAVRTFDYRRDDLAERVGERPPAVILDHRLDEYLQFDADVAKQGARVVGIGNTTAAAEFSNVAAARATELQLSLMSMFNTPDLRAVLDRLASLMAAGDVVPEVARTYSLDEAATAQRDVLSESFFGKLVIEP